MLGGVGALHGLSEKSGASCAVDEGQGKVSETISSFGDASC